MSVNPSYPGIYIQELSSNSHAITPAPTSIAAFVGYSHPFQTVAFNAVQECFSFSDYQTYFGPLFSSGLIDASLPRAVYQFFLNGGSTAYVVGLQPGLFDATGALIGERLGGPQGRLASGLTINASSSGGTSGTANFPVVASYPTPAISALSPSSASATSAGGVGFTLVVTGSNFAPGATVSFNGSSIAPQPGATSTQLTVVVPASDLMANPGAANVTVSNPAASGGSAPTSPAFAFTFTGPVASTISSISPLGSVVNPAQDVQLTISGSNFGSTSTVNINGFNLTPNPATSSTTLVVDLPHGDLPTAVGPTNVTVTNTLGGVSPPAVFTMYATAPPPAANPAPTIASLTPASVAMGGPNLSLQVNGANFTSGSIVYWNGAALPTSFVSANQLVATVLSSRTATANSANVTVVTPAPGGGASQSFTFTTVSSNLTPTISSLSPSTALTSANSVQLTINGANFIAASATSTGSTVLWNGVALPSSAITSITPSQIQVNLPANSIASAGAFNVAVTNPSNGFGIVFTALELTDVTPMTVTIANVRNAGATFDLIVNFGVQVETYRGLQLSGPPAQPPDQIVNPVSKLIQIGPDTSNYPAAIAAGQYSLTLPIPANLSTGFSAEDFTLGQGPAPGVFQTNGVLDNLEIFNLLMTPGVTDFSVVSAVLAFAERKRAFAIVDAPLQAPAFGSSIANPQPIQYWMEGLNGDSGAALPESQNGAVYYPYLTSNDPVTGNNIPIAPSGFVAGIFAATDASRGVWKAPAGLATVVKNTVGPVLAGAMNDPQQGVLNLDAINVLRSFSGVGTVVWGSRTLVADNAAYKQWMYVPVRRMTLFIEQSLLASLRWVVFEPNDEPLWIAITNTINAFLLSLFRQGALQGATPSDAFQVKCDSSTTSADDQLQGIVNIFVAFAPLKPAEFVIIQIAQLAGQTAGS